MPPPASSIPGRLLHALQTISISTPRLIQPGNVIPGASSGAAGASRRASVAIIIRLRPEKIPAVSPTSSAGASPTASPSTPTVPLPAPTPIPPATPAAAFELLDSFFKNSEWARAAGTTAEILLIKRATRATDKWSGHVAFPGGRQEPDDEGDTRYTAMRETWEEVGIDLAEQDWIYVGGLDEREITTSLGKRLLMVLSPHVFLHTSPHAPMPELQESEVASAHWIPLEQLVAPQVRYGEVVTDIATRLAPHNVFARKALQLLVGSMRFSCILLPNEPIATGQSVPMPPSPSGTLPQLKLWGISLGLALDLLAHLDLPTLPKKGKKAGLSAAAPGGDLSTYPSAVSTLDPSTKTPTALCAPSMASIFPKFSYPDINILIWLFGYRYRRTLKQPPPPHSSGRVNWAGMSIGSYYAAVRRALVVAIVFRAIALVGGLGWLALAVKRRIQANRGLGLRRGAL